MEVEFVGVWSRLSRFWWSNLLRFIENSTGLFDWQLMLLHVYKSTIVNCWGLAIP